MIYGTMAILVAGFTCSSVVFLSIHQWVDNDTYKYNNYIFLLVTTIKVVMLMIVN